MHFLFALTDGGGTVPPELGVARRMVERGHRVRVLAERSMAAEVEATGAEVLWWQPARSLPAGGGPPAAEQPSHTAYRDWETNNPFKLARGMADHMIAGPAPGHAEGVLAAIDAARPDRVVTSFTAFGAMIGAEVAAVRFDVLIPNIYPVPAPGLPPFGLGLRPARTVVGRTRDRIGSWVSTRTLNHYTLPRLNALRRRLGLPALGEIWDQVHAARRQLVLASKAFDLPAQLPTAVRYVGPVLDEPVFAARSTWHAPPGGDPLVLVAMSSTYQGQRESLQAVIDALARLPLRGVVTTGPGLDPGELRGVSNVAVKTSAPHHEVLAEAALVITHGGHGTVMRALAAGLPLVVMPHGRDQPENAVRIATRGAGLTVRKSASVRRIAAAVRHVLDDPAYTRAAEQLGGQIRADMAGSALVAELEAP